MVYGFDRAIKRSNCFHSTGGKDKCLVSSNPFMISFGIIEIVFSQIPDFHKTWWLSIIAAIMSFAYSIIGLALGIAKVAGYITTFISLIEAVLKKKVKYILFLYFNY